MNYKFLPAAEQDLIDAVVYYESCEHSLGIDFVIEVDKTISRIIEYPTAWTTISYDFRRCLLDNFPYGIIYSIEDNFILIISIMNLHRHPEYWKNRK